MTTKRIEVCYSDEWLRVFGPLDCGVEDDSEDASREYQSIAIRTLEADPRAVDFEIDWAIGQRRMCHGWNGAKFTFQSGGIATFADLTDDEKDAIYAADEAATAAANAMLAASSE